MGPIDYKARARIPSQWSPRLDWVGSFEEAVHVVIGRSTRLAEASTIVTDAKVWTWSEIFEVCQREDYPLKRRA